MSYLEIIDLTQEIDENTQVFPGSSNLKILKWSNDIIDGYDSEMIFTSTHIVYILMHQFILTHQENQQKKFL